MKHLPKLPLAALAAAAALLSGCTGFGASSHSM